MATRLSSVSTGDPQVLTEDLEDRLFFSRVRVYRLSEDLYIAFNAQYDSAQGRWSRVDTGEQAWLLVINMQNNMPGESMKTFTLWECAAGGNPIGAFTAAGGWLLAATVTQFKDLVIGGRTIEMDGNGVVPYGRFNHGAFGGAERTGILTNAYGDDSGRDKAASPCWFVGRQDDAFVVCRAIAEAGAPSWTTLHTLRSDGIAVGKTFTVAELPSPAAPTGARAFVTDASATTFAAVVAGGGANGVPVYCDGTNWRIG